MDSPILQALLQKYTGPLTHQTAEPVGKPSTLADFIMMLKGYPENYVDTGSMDSQLFRSNPANDRVVLGSGQQPFSYPMLPPAGAKVK